jgi:hypothetical protein
MQKENSKVSFGPRKKTGLAMMYFFAAITLPDNYYKRFSTKVFNSTAHAFFLSRDEAKKVLASSRDYATDLSGQLIDTIDEVRLREQVKSIVERHGGNISDINIFIEHLDDSLNLLIKKFPNDSVNIESIKMELALYILAKKILEEKNL